MHTIVMELFQDHPGPCYEEPTLRRCMVDKAPDNFRQAFRMPRLGRSIYTVLFYVISPGSRDQALVRADAKYGHTVIAT